MTSEQKRMTSEQKIDAWHDGSRIVNMNACSVEKLLDYYIWCIRKGYVFIACNLRDKIIDKRSVCFNFPELQVCEPLSVDDFTRFAATYRDYYKKENNDSLLLYNCADKICYIVDKIIEYTYKGKKITLNILYQTISDGNTTVSFKEHPELAINLFIKTLYGKNK